jgi:hypothetical protein
MATVHARKKDAVEPDPTPPGAGFGSIPGIPGGPTLLPPIRPRLSFKIGAPDCTTFNPATCGCDFMSTGGVQVQAIDTAFWTCTLDGWEENLPYFQQVGGTCGFVKCACRRARGTCIGKSLCAGHVFNNLDVTFSAWQSNGGVHQWVLGSSLDPPKGKRPP